MASHGCELGTTSRSERDDRYVYFPILRIVGWWYQILIVCLSVCVCVCVCVCVWCVCVGVCVLVCLLSVPFGEVSVYLLCTEGSVWV